MAARLDSIDVNGTRPVHLVGRKDQIAMYRLHSGPSKTGTRDTGSVRVPLGEVLPFDLRGRDRHSSNPGDPDPGFALAPIISVMSSEVVCD